jgi:hypothetical protein
MMDYICHHGIKGQKWGVRRYQNSDGSLTAAGRKRYSGNGFEFTDSFPEEKSAGKTKAEYWKNQDLLTGNKVSLNNPRAVDAAKLAIKARNELTGDTIDPNNKADQGWMLFEDQTIGQALVADLIIRGNAADKVKSMIEEANNDYISINELQGTPGLFEMVEGYRLGDIADIAENIYRKEKK